MPDKLDYCSLKWQALNETHKVELKVRSYRHKNKMADGMLN